MQTLTGWRRLVFGVTATRTAVVLGVVLALPFCAMGLGHRLVVSELSGRPAKFLEGLGEQHEATRRCRRIAVDPNALVAERGAVGAELRCAVGRSTRIGRRRTRRDPRREQDNIRLGGAAQ